MDFNTIRSLQEAYNNVVEQTSTVTSPGGADGKVTVNKSYPATLNNQKGVKSTGPTGTEYFTPNFPGSSVPNRAEAKFKSVASQQYEKVPKDQRTMDLNKPVSVTDRTKYDPSYKPPGMKKENYEGQYGASWQEAYNQVHETMVSGGGPKPQPKPQSTSDDDVDDQGNRSHDLFTGKENPDYKPTPKPTTPTPAAPAPTRKFDIRDRDPSARAGFDPRFDKKPVAQMLQAKEPYQAAKPPVSVQRATPAPAAAPAPAPAPTPDAPAPKPEASTPAAKTGKGIVLAKKDGISGTLNKATGQFTAGTFDKDQEARYTQRRGAEQLKADASKVLTKNTNPENRQPQSPPPAAAGAPAKPGTTPAPAKPGTSPAPAKPTSGLTDEDRKRIDDFRALGPLQKLQKKGEMEGELAKLDDQKRKEVMDYYNRKESFDLFDYLLEYLVAEGYADTNKAALAIMANMSEEWKQSIVEGLTDEQESRRRDLSKAINKAGTPGYPGVNDPATRKMQGEYIRLQQLKGV